LVLKNIEVLFFNQSVQCVISVFRRAVNEIFALLGCYGANNGIYRRFGTDILARNAVNYQLTMSNIPEQRRSQNYCCSLTIILPTHMKITRYFRN